MEPFKNIYNPQSVKKIATQILISYPKFDSYEFEKEILNSLNDLEMKDRVRLISEQLKSYLPDAYKKSIKILLNCVGETKLNGFLLWPFTHYIETYGIDYFDESLSALKELTKYFTGEFAIRPFLQKYDQRVFDLFFIWKDDENEHVRRLVSEGTRPRLPWGLKVQKLIDNPERNIDLILHLSKDPSLYVRKSVGNHLNDISHLNPGLVLKAVKNIKDKGIVKRATRTMLKKSNPEAFKINNYNPNANLNIKKVVLSPRVIKEGEYFNLKFKMQNESKKSEKIQLAMKLFFPKKNGSLSPKVFHIKDLTLKSNTEIEIEKKYHFKKVTTRTHYPGKYQLVIMANGNELKKTSFELS